MRSGEYTVAPREHRSDRRGVRLGPVVFAPGLVPTLVSIVLFVLSIGLGLWQLGRAESKLAQQAQFDTSTRASVIPLADAVADLPAHWYRQVQLRGSFDAEHQLLLDNRTHQGVAGYHVLTPLRLSHQRFGALVNRGWVPVGQRRELLPDVSLSTGAVDIQGLLTPAPRVFLLGESGYEQAGWPRVVQSIDFGELEALLGYRLVPAVVQLAPGEADGFVRTWSPYVGIGPERHRAYAVQWFSLAFALLAFYVIVNTRRIPTEGGRR